jgi:uncharacterized surface protein with fasciclin (FAS1) repeats
MIVPSTTIQETAMNDILTTLREDPAFETLLHALNKVSLLDVLAEGQPITLFAPDNQAFTRINLEEIMQDSSKLTDILTYHITDGEHLFDGLEDEESIETRNGKNLTAHLEVGQLRIDNAGLTKTDIHCSNGIIHVIDNVFLPQFSGWYCACC